LVPEENDTLSYGNQEFILNLTDELVLEKQTFLHPDWNLFKLLVLGVTQAQAVLVGGEV
jgi:hypothetical protein